MKQCLFNKSQISFLQHLSLQETKIIPSSQQIRANTVSFSLKHIQTKATSRKLTYQNQIQVIPLKSQVFL